MAATEEWLGIAIAALGGFMTALAGAFRAAWSLSKQMSDLRLELMKQNSEQTKELADKFDDKIGHVEERLRLVERDMARRSNNRH